MGGGHQHDTGGLGAQTHLTVSLGRSPQAEIRRVQIERIRRLLVETEYPLKKIAELTGFEHVEYMSVVFKRLTSLTPGEFRRRHKDDRRR